MRNNFLLESAIALILIAILTLVVNPFHLWMPDMAHMTALGFLLVLFVLYAGFILRERGGDERDVLHRMIAARAAFFAGTSILTIAVFIGALIGEVDHWLVFALVGMIAAKLVARFYADRNL